MRTLIRGKRSGVGRQFKPGTVLAELVIAISISAILILGIQSAIAIALRSVPDPRSGPASTLKANRIADQLTTELETAQFITARTATSISFTVPDRNGDAIPERIRYQWSGVPGGKLTRQYNSGTAETLAEQVDLFSLTPATQSTAETYPLPGIEDGTESLLVDYNSVSGLANNDVTSSNWFGQHFKVALPPGAIAWRPTRLLIMSKKASLLGETSVQVRPATTSLVPSSRILEQFSLTEALLPLGYTWQPFNLTQASAMPSEAAIALVLKQAQGAKAVTVQSSKDYQGLLKASDGVNWSYDASKSLVSQLYGKLTRSSGEGSFSTYYLTSFDVALRMTGAAPTAPTLQTSAMLLNHPELLTGKWEATFDQNPTQVDVNGDGAADWSCSTGTFDMSSVTSGVWRTNGAQLTTTPGCDFAKTTIVDLEFQSLTSGGRGAVFSVQALRSGSRCAPVTVCLTKEAENTQTLCLQTKLNDSQTQTLITIPNLPNQPVTLHLVIHPADSSVTLKANNVEYGTYTLTPFMSADASRGAVIAADGCTAEFADATIRVLEN